MTADFRAAPAVHDSSKAVTLESRQTSDPTELEAALLQLPNVADCAVLGRSAADGEQWIAYVVPSGPFARKTVESRLRDSAPELRLADAYVLVTALPLTESGALDEAALIRLPVLEEQLAQALEAELLSNPRIEHAAAFMEDLPRRPPALHVADLVGSDTLDGARGGSSSPELAAQSNGAAQDAALDAREENRQSLPLAVQHGTPLERSGEAPETLPGVLEAAARRVKDRGITYLAGDGATREQSLSDLFSEARRICHGLQQRGLKQGQHVLLQLSEADDVLPAFWGCMLGGLIPAITPIPPSYEAGTNELERLYNVLELLDRPPLLMRDQLRAAVAPLQNRLSIGDEKLIALEALRAATEAYDPPSLKPDDVAFLVFTSGSTGAPKVIMLSHRNILTRSQGTNQLCRHEVSDRILNWLPFDHIGSISDWHLRCVDLGCHMVYCSKEYVLGDPLNWLRLIDRFRITHSWAPNFAYALVNDALGRTAEQFDLSSMKALLTAGEAVSSNTVHDFLRRLAPHGLARTALRPAFGMAELGSGVTYYLPTEEHPVRVKHIDRGQLDGALRRIEPDDPRAIGFTSLGPVIPGAGMRIVDEHNVALQEWTVGRLQIFGGPVCQGYYRNPEANREVFVGDGWFNTGDRGFVAEGELYLTGRDKESLIINGANFSNSEIEAAVEEVPKVQVSFTAACAVRLVGDPEERLAIFFSPAEVTASELPQLLRKVQNGITRKTGVKPDYLLPVQREVIPKTAIGKIQRKQLVKRFEDGEFDALSKRVDVLLENERTIPDWFLSPGWRSRVIRRRTRSKSRRYLLIADDQGLAAELRVQLERRGADCVISPRIVGSAQSSPAQLGFTDVVDLSGHAPMPNAAATNGDRGAKVDGLASATAARLAVGLLQGLEQYAQEAVSTDPGARLRYWVVASHAQVVSPNDTIDAARTIVPAILRAFVQDNPSVDSRHLDVPFSSEPGALAKHASLVVAELDALDTETEIAYRNGARLVPGFDRVAFAPIAERAKPLTPGGFYLITGGLGGVGVKLGRYLLATWNASLLIIGRTPLDATIVDQAAKAASPNRKQELLGELEKLGCVRYQALDLSNSSELERAVARLEGELALPLAGAFHLASVYHERPAAEESLESFASVLAPKIDGAVALHELLASRPQAFVVCFSSVVSVFGGAGFTAYAAANRFLDAFCQEQRNRYRRRSYSLDWSVWDGLGIAAESAAAEVLARLGPGADGSVSAADVSARLAEAERSRGYLRMPVIQGLRSLVAALSLPPTRLLVGVDVSHPSMRSATNGAVEPLLGIRGAFALRDAAQNDTEGQSAAPPLRVQDRFGQTVNCELRQLSAPPLTAEGRLDREAVLAELRGAARQLVAPETPLQHQLVEIWKDVLGLDTLGITESFFDLGGTSLLSVRLFAEIERRIGVSLQLATLFQAATIQTLAKLLEQKLAQHSPDSLAPLAAANGKSALFLIHDLDGETALYRALAQRLAPRVRVYGLSPYKKDRFPSLHTRIDDMVSHYVEKIKSVEPAGPYSVGGLGAGGVLAFEVACRLQSQGELVTLVALLDAADTNVRFRRPPAIRGFKVGIRDGTAGRESAGRVRTALDTVKGAISAQLAKGAKSAFDQVRVRLLRQYTSRTIPLPWFLEYIPPDVVYRYATSGYRPSLLQGRLALYRASHAASEADHRDAPARALTDDEQLGWSARASGGVDVVDVAGGHLSMLAEPHVADLAEKLAAKVLQEN